MTQDLEGFTDEVPGVVLMATMLEEEYEHHIRTGGVPAERRPCLLCYRYMLSYSLCNFGSDRVTLPRDVILHWFYNSVDAPDGYRREACLLPNDRIYNGLVFPICGFKHSHYKARKDTGGVWWIDQRAALAADRSPPAKVGH
jgi:hypothetical protein